MHFVAKEIPCSQSERYSWLAVAPSLLRRISPSKRGEARAQKSADYSVANPRRRSWDETLGPFGNESSHHVPTTPRTEEHRTPSHAAGGQSNLRRSQGHRSGTCSYTRPRSPAPNCATGVECFPRRGPDRSRRYIPCGAPPW